MADDEPFYLSPVGKVKDENTNWYTKVPVGHNTLANVVKNLCKDAGIQGHFTNHSLRVTTATLGLEKGIPTISYYKNEPVIVLLSRQRDTKERQQQ